MPPRSQTANWSRATTFRFSGVKPALGRLFLDEDSKTRGLSPVVVLSHNYLENPVLLRSACDQPEHPGQRIAVQADRMASVQPGFDSVISGTRPDFFVPITMKAQMTPLWDELEDPRSKWLNTCAVEARAERQNRRRPASIRCGRPYALGNWKTSRRRRQQFRDRFVAKSYVTLWTDPKEFRFLANRCGSLCSF